MGTPATTQRSALEAEGYVTTWAGPVWIAASAVGVQRVQLPDWHGVPPLSPASDQGRVVIETPGDAEEALRHLRQALKEIAEYFDGSRRTFTVPLDLRGPAFYRQVWAMVGSVPRGETRTYGEIALALGRLAGKPGGGRGQRRQSRGAIRAVPPYRRQRRRSHWIWPWTPPQATAPDDGRCRSGR